MPVVQRRLSSRLPTVLILVAAAGPLARAADAPGGEAPSLRQRIESLVAACERAGGGTAGVSVVDLATGKTIAAIRADRPFTPASNQKLLTSAFALLRLGGDFRFITGVMLLGEDLVVAGDGDPTLGDPRLAEEFHTGIYDELDRWAAAVRDHLAASAGPGRGRGAAGWRVRHVLLCDAQDNPPRHPDWPAAQRRRWYAAPVSTLNFHDNCFDVAFALGGGRAVPIIHPAGRHFRVVNRLQAGTKHIWSLLLSDGDSTLTLTGTAAGASEEDMSVAVDRPALLLGRTFADRLERAGVAVAGRIQTIHPRQVEWSAAQVVRFTETPLALAMYRANKRSLNMAAESIFLRAGDGTWAGSADMMDRTLSRAFALPAGGIRPSDGGGLSRSNRVSPAAMTAILAGMVHHPDIMVLLTSLPIGGVDGTLERRFTAPPCRGRVLGKTGYIGGVSTLSGYLLDRSRHVRIAFSILVNDLRGGTDAARGLHESICRLLIETLDAEAGMAAAQMGGMPASRGPPEPS